MDYVTHLRALEDEVSILKERFQDTDTGNLRTAVSVLENRIFEMENEIRAMLARK
jgi:hypothetical protein